MRVSKILCTLLLFGPLAVEGNEAPAPKRSNSPMTAVDSATGRDAHPGAKQVDGRGSARAAEKGGGVKDRDAGAAVASRPATTQQMGRANADRLRSLLGAQARGRVVRQPLSHPAGSAHAPTLMGGAGQKTLGATGTQFGVTPARQPTRGVASPSVARPVPSLSALAIHSTNGLPRAPGLAVVGGPVVGRAVHNSSIDGTRLRHKF